MKKVPVKYSSFQDLPGFQGLQLQLSRSSMFETLNILIYIDELIQYHSVQNRYYQHTNPVILINAIITDLTKLVQIVICLPEPTRILRQQIEKLI